MATTLPENFTARPAMMDDVEAAVELVNACSIEQIGRPEWEVHQFRNDWQSPNFKPATDLRVVFTPDDKLVGYAGVWDSEPYVQMFGWGNVHPEHKVQGIGTYLAQWIEERAHQSIPKAPQDTRVVLLQSRLSTDKAAQALLLQQGYRMERYGFRMFIEMDAPPPETVIPEGITICPFVREKQMRALVMADRETFRDHRGYVESPFEEEYKEFVHWIDNDPDHDPSLWFLAMYGDEIAGMSLCRFKMAEDPGMGYVETLAVRRPWRRRGVALALLYHSFGELYRRGQRKVGLDVDAQSLTGAPRVYEKAGMYVQRQTTVYEKELRSGQYLMTRYVENQ
jgi:ribosomal protein S18 acetylase RimI-like enzyme